MSEDKQPESKPKLSVKRLNLLSLASLGKSFIHLDPNNDFLLWLLTPTGIIIGDVREPIDSNSENFIKEVPQDNGTLGSKFEVDLGLALHQTSKTIKELKSNSDETTNNDFKFDSSLIHLENALFIPGGNYSSSKIRIGQLIVFVDQVVAASLIPRSQFEQLS